MDQSLIYVIIWLHVLSDFFLQSDRMAQNKSSSNKWLSIHIIVYSTPFLWLGWKYALINGAAHWITDFVSSRITKRLWAKKEVHYFFAVIGVDQAIHMTTLVYTLKWAEPLWK